MSVEFVKTQIQRFKGALALEPHRRKELLPQIQKLEASIEKETIKDQLKVIGVKHHPGLGLKKLRILLEKNS